tara:strand:- start:104 stop:472 length:369 start_codon:yes stop_codon:yes gene_type:complete
VKILLVEDSEKYLTEMKGILEDQDYEVITATDGLKGLEALKDNNDLSLIISDLNMPNLDGLSMCEKIRTDNIPSPPIMMVTTEGSLELKNRGKSVGVRYWLIKPVPGKMLLSMVEKAIQATS